MSDQQLPKTVPPMPADFIADFAITFTKTVWRKGHKDIDDLVKESRKGPLQGPSNGYGAMVSTVEADAPPQDTVHKTVAQDELNRASWPVPAAGFDQFTWGDGFGATIGVVQFPDAKGRDAAMAALRDGGRAGKFDDSDVYHSRSGNQAALDADWTKVIALPGAKVLYENGIATAMTRPMDNHLKDYSKTLRARFADQFKDPPPLDPRHTHVLLVTKGEVAETIAALDSGKPAKSPTAKAVAIFAKEIAQPQWAKGPDGKLAPTGEEASGIEALKALRDGFGTGQHRRLTLRLTHEQTGEHYELMGKVWDIRDKRDVPPPAAGKAARAEGASR